ncbi:MAG: hypothetical protein O3C43_14225 [Verrucomicrobia bacterium]|nr:hypothetical protein [Verrucomicrobiota bacterium]
MLDLIHFKTAVDIFNGMPSADMMARMDTDKDGKLSEKEFAAANQRPAEGRGPGQGKGGGEGQRARPPE